MNVDGLSKFTEEKFFKKIIDFDDVYHKHTLKATTFFHDEQQAIL